MGVVIVPSLQGWPLATTESLLRPFRDIVVVKTASTGLVVHDWFSPTSLTVEGPREAKETRPGQHEEIAATPNTNSRRDVVPIQTNHPALPMTLHGVFGLSTIQ